jgi:hypothetical protein
MTAAKAAPRDILVPNILYTYDRCAPFPHATTHSVSLPMRWPIPIVTPTATATLVAPMAQFFPVRSLIDHNFSPSSAISSAIVNAVHHFEILLQDVDSPVVLAMFVAS